MADIGVPDAVNLPRYDPTRVILFLCAQAQSRHFVLLTHRRNAMSPLELSTVDLPQHSCPR